MRKLLQIFLLLVVCWGTSKCSNIISIQANLTASGDTGKFSIMMRNHFSVNGANFILQYNPVFIKPLTVKPVGNASVLNGSTAYMLGENKIAFILYDQGINYLSADSAVIFEVEYVVKDSLHDTTSTELVFTEGMVADSSISVVPFEYVNSTLLISPLVGVKDKIVELPKEYRLFQNYPNPFNPTTTFKYDLPFNSKVTLRIFNVLGQKVNTLVDGMQEPGFKSLEWNATNVASGVYFYHLEAMSTTDPSKIFTQVKKMILVK